MTSCLLRLAVTPARGAPGAGRETAEAAEGGGTAPPGWGGRGGGHSSLSSSSCTRNTATIYPKVKCNDPPPGPILPAWLGGGTSQGKELAGSFPELPIFVSFPYSGEKTAAIGVYKLPGKENSEL